MPSCESVRQDFPELEERGVVYLDNAASTLKPVQVIEAMREFAGKRYANVHRGVHRLSVEASIEYEEAHSVVAGFIGARGMEEVVFLRNTTEALNTVALSLAVNGLVGRGDEIVISEAEHNSNLLPWYTLARLTGARLRLVPVDGEGVPMWDRIGEYLTERTRVVAIGHVSNVTGYRSPVARVAREAGQVGALVVVDGAQSVPHMPVNVSDLGADFLAFSGHKMLGPTGIGVLWGRRDLLEDLDPPAPGGGTVVDVSREEGGLRVEWEEPPWKFEAGTPPIIEAVGLAAAVKYLARLGMEWVERHEQILTKAALEMLEEAGAVIVGPRDARLRAGIVSFNIPGVEADHVGLALSDRGIAVRTGRHCAFLLHKRLGLSGSVRASFYVYNCLSDVEALADAVRAVAAGFRGGSSR